MGKPGLSMFSGRRKSSINALDEVQPIATPEQPASDGGFRVLDQATVLARKAQREEAAKKSQERSSRFGRLSGFGTSGNKARNRSFDDDSLSSSKRDSKSSNGTYSSRPYNMGLHGSTSTLPSSAESDPADNLFANLPPRPPLPQHNSSPNSLSVGAMKKDLPPPPPAKARTSDFGSYSSSLYSSPYSSSTTPAGRTRAMTTSSYASTAIPPKLESDLDFGASSFGDMFGGIDRKESPDFTHDSPSAGRSLLAGKRATQVEPIKIERKLEVEPPMKSWDSRGSNENLITGSASPTEDELSPPPPPPPHKYAPISSRSPEMGGSERFEDSDARMVRQSFIARKSVRESPAERTQDSALSSSAASLETPLSSLSISDNAKQKAPVNIATSPLSDDDDGDLFAAAKKTPVRKPVPPAVRESIPPPTPTAGQKTLPKRMTAAEFRVWQEQQKLQPPDDSSDSEDYEDEDEAIERREQEQRMIRQKQQMSMAREELRRTTTAPVDMSHPMLPSMGFSPDISLTQDDEDDEVPLGILAAHGFPKAGRPPTQPSNAGPSYFRSTTPGLPDRPASAGALGNRASFKPPFAKNLPDDPHASFIGGGLVRPTVRESMGFGRSASSVYGEPTGMSTVAYHDPSQPHMSLVEQIHAREGLKPKFTGGASSKIPPGGPFTGALANQMNPNNANPTRMSQMPMQGMMGGMMGGMNPTMMAGQMPMMGMNATGYPMPQSDQLMQMQQMQQMLLQQQYQLAAYAQQQQQQQQQFQPDPRMSMLPPNFSPNLGVSNQFPQNNGFLNVGTLGVPNGRPMSIMSQNGALPQQPRPYSTPSTYGTPPTGAFGQPQLGMPMPTINGGPAPGYTPSIAPSERSNIGLSARYRPVVTGNGMPAQQDALSTVSSQQTLQASSGANVPKSPGMVKGILKKAVVPQVTVREDDEENWGGMADRRKNKFADAAGSGFGKENGLPDLSHLRGVEGF